MIIFNFIHFSKSFIHSSPHQCHHCQTSSWTWSLFLLPTSSPWLFSFHFLSSLSSSRSLSSFLIFSLSSTFSFNRFLIVRFRHFSISSLHSPFLFLNILNTLMALSSRYMQTATAAPTTTFEDINTQDPTWLLTFLPHNTSSGPPTLQVNEPWKPFTHMLNARWQSQLHHSNSNIMPPRRASISATVLSVVGSLSLTWWRSRFSSALNVHLSSFRSRFAYAVQRVSTLIRRIRATIRSPTSADTASLKNTRVMR